MALKFTFSHARIEIDDALVAKGTVYFTIREDTAVGQLKKNYEDNASFTVSFPVSKADIRTAARTAITDAYPGATAE